MERILICSLIVLRIWYLLAYRHTVVEANTLPMSDDKYIWFFIAFIVWCFWVKWNIFRLVLIVLRDEILITNRGSILNSWFCICCLIAGLENIWIIMFLCDFGRLKLRLRINFVCFIIGIMSSLAFHFKFRLIVVVAVNTFAIVTHGIIYK